jgi:hypothetical protein
MRCHEPGMQDACDGIIGRAMKQWVSRHRPPAIAKRQVMQKAAALASPEASEAQIWSLVVFGMRVAGCALYRILAREPRLLSVAAEGGMAPHASIHLHMANFELLYSSSGGVGMLSLMG